MESHTIRRINLLSFVTGLTTIVVGVVIGVLGVWGAISHEDWLLWKLLGTDMILFAGAVLTNLAIACYGKPGGTIA